MQLTWYGHAAFQLSGQSGEGDNATVRVVLDPYRAPDVGTYAPIDDEAEIVAISHENEKYHSWIAAVRGPNGAPPIVVDGLALLDQPQPRIIGGLPFTATRVWENTDRREPIAMIGIEMEGIRFLHMGDCGHALTSEEVAACGRVDVLLALAGAGPTIALPDLANFIAMLKPRIVIPMHFGNDKINLNLRPVEEFLALMPPRNVHRFDTPTVTLAAQTLPSVMEVWVLPPAR